MADIQTVILYGSLFLTLFFEVFLLITYLEVRDELKSEKILLAKERNYFPSTTIIVPCFNEEKTVAATIRSILDLDYPKDKLSLILIDDGSTDGTAKILEEFRHLENIKIFSKKNGGKHTALNLALEHVESDLVGCLDADSFVDSSALKKIIPFFEDGITMAVIPSIKVHEAKTVLQYVQKVEYSWGIFLRRMLSSIGALYVTPGPFSIFRTRVFRELGGYRLAHHTEDLEMALRMQKSRYKIVNSQGAHVYTVAPAGLKKLYRQRVRWTYGFLNNAFDYREMFFNKKYGHIGIFILPIATSSIFTSLYIIGNVLWNGLSKVFDALIRFQAVGFAGKFQFPSFDWYFINTGIISFLTLSALTFTIIILFLAIKMADGRKGFGKEVFYYLLLYTFIVPLWLSKALFSSIFRRQIQWK